MTDDEIKRVADFGALLLEVSGDSPGRNPGWTEDMADALCRTLPMRDAEALFVLSVGLAIDCAPMHRKTYVAIALIEWIAGILGKSHLHGEKSATDTLEIVTRCLVKCNGLDGQLGGLTLTGRAPAKSEGGN